jgi:hypothetical protein
MFYQKNFSDIIKKVEETRKNGAVDLSVSEDLSIAVMNLLSFEEHLFFTGIKTGKNEYFEMINETRDTRIELMKELLGNEKLEGETWCASKHLLSATMRLIETGNKLRGDGKIDEAKKMHDRAGEIFAVFWALRFKLVNVEEVKENVDVVKNPWSVGEILNRIVNCCDDEIKNAKGK